MSHSFRVRTLYTYHKGDYSCLLQNQAPHQCQEDIEKLFSLTTVRFNAEGPKTVSSNGPVLFLDFSMIFQSCPDTQADPTFS